MDLNETLLAMKAYAPYHQLYAISVVFCEINKMNDSVPSPSVVLKKLQTSNLLDKVVNLTGDCLNKALENASEVATENNKIFVPQNWIKSKTSLKDIKSAIKYYLSMLKMISGGKELQEKLSTSLAMDKEDFQSRWTAD